MRLIVSGRVRIRGNRLRARKLRAMSNGAVDIADVPFRNLRDSGLSPTTIARRGGRSRAGARARIAALLKARSDRAVRLGAMSRAQARALYAEQTAALPAFMGHTYRTPAQQVSFLCRPH